MTTLATAFVEVRPDTTGFGRTLTSGVDKSAKVASGRMSSHFGSALKGIAAAFGGVFAVSKGISFFKDTFAEATEAQKATAQTAAVIKSTGGIANVSAKQIGNLSNAISAKVGIDDEAIQSGANMLLTFKNIRNETGKGNDVFNQATKAVTDLSVGMNQGLKASAVQVGKALNDPVKGMTALSRVGVTFNDAQKATVKHLVATGHTMQAQKLILKELNSEFKGSAEAQATPAEKAAVAWSNFKELIGTQLLPIVGKLADFFTTKVVPALTLLFEQMKTGEGVGGQVADVFRRLKGVVSDAAGTIQTASRWMVEHREVLLSLGAAVGAAVLAYKAFMVVNSVLGVVKTGIVLLKAWRAGTLAVTAAQLELNTALLLNPVGIFVAALAALGVGLFIAYKKSDTFRKVVDDTWKVVREAIAKAWDGYIKPALAAFSHFLTADLMPAVQKLWTKVVKPVFAAVGKAVAWAWGHVIQPALKLWWAFMTKVLFPVIRFLFTKVVKPVFALVAVAIKVAWNIIYRIFQAWWSYLSNVLFPVIRFLFDNVVKPVFTKVGNLIQTVWNNSIKPSFNALKDGVDAVKTAFSKAVGAIGDIWNGLKDAAAGPVRFVVNTVYNNGIRKVVNAIPGVTDLPKLNFARGGVMPGYTPGRDVHHFYSPTGGHLHLSGGEPVMRPEFGKAVGKGWVDRMNAAARNGGTNAVKKALYQSGIYHFASGGIFRPVATGAVGSNGVHDQWTGFPAVDIRVGTGTPVHAAASGRVTVSEDLATSYGHWIKIASSHFQSLYAHLAKRLVGVGTSVAGGQLIGYSDSTGNSTGPHLHFGVSGANVLDFMRASTNYGSAGSAPGAGGVGGFLSGLWSKAQGLVSGLGDKIGGWVSHMKDMGGWGPMLSGMVSNVAGAAKDWASSKVSAAVKAVGQVASNGLGLNGGTVGQIVKGLAQRSGWGTGAEWSALSKLIASESSWNPKAQNPSSSAYGLFQFLDSTWATVGGHKTSDPNLQTQYGLAYIAHRYGDPIGAWNYHLAHGTYDQGGLASGAGVMAKGTIRPERVLSPHQTEAFDRLVATLERNGIGPMVHIDQINTRDDKAAAYAIRREQAKALSLMGSR